MNLKNFKTKHPALANALLKELDDIGDDDGEGGGDSPDVDVSTGKALSFQGADGAMYVIPTMWVDSGVDSSSEIVKTENLSKVSSKEFDQACNMSVTVTVFKKTKPGLPGHALVSGNNGEETGYTLYSCD